MRAQLADPLSALKDHAERLAEDSGALDLLPAIESGLLELQMEGLNGDPLSLVAAMTSLIRQRLLDPRRRVLFDGGSRGLARAVVPSSAGENIAGFTRAGQAAVGSGLVARLPAFPEAPMDELLELRTDLLPALGRYRSVTVSLAATLTNAVGPEVEQAIDDMYEERVRPALAEIDETLMDHGLVRSLAKDASLDIRDFLLSGAGIYTGLSHATDLGSAAAVAAGSAAGLGPAAARATWARHESRIRTSRHELFFLYEANRRLA